MPRTVQQIQRDIDGVREGLARLKSQMEAQNKKEKDLKAELKKAKDAQAGR